MRTRRTWAAIAAAGATLATAVTIAQPATAAGTFSCPNYSNTAHLLTVGGSSTDMGALYKWTYSPMGTDAVGTLSGNTKFMNSGWQQFGAVKAGAAGVLWAFSSDGKAHYYDWNVGATTWAPENEIIPPPVDMTKPQTTPPTLMASPWAAYTTASGKMRVTVDTKNQIFTLDTTGLVSKYAYNRTTSTWTSWAQPVVQLGTGYDMLWASDNTTLWARKTDGSLTRVRIDPGSNRVADRYDGATGWGAFKNIFSAGGDTMFAVGTAGNLKRYRFDEDNRTWPGGALFVDKDVKAKWATYRDVVAVGNTCTRSYPSVSSVTVPAETNVPIEAISGTLSAKIGLAYSNDASELKFASIDNAAGGAVSWSTINDGDGSFGRPALAVPGDGLIHVYSHTVKGRTAEKVQSVPGGSAMTAGTDLGGALTGATDAAVTSNGTTVLAATDAGGNLWVSHSIPKQFSAWQSIAAGLAPSSYVTAQTGRDNTVAIYGRTPAGHVVTTSVGSTGALLKAPTATVDLGVPGSGATGTIAAMSYTTNAQRIAVTDSSGQVWTKAQDRTTFAWDTSWTPVSVVGGGQVAGSPSIVLSPFSSRVHLVARRAVTNDVVVASESVQGTGSFSEFAVPADQYGQPVTNDIAVAADPTAFTYTGSDGQRRWGIVSYDSNRTLWAWFADAGQPLELQRGTSADETLTLKKLGKLPR